MWAARCFFLRSSVSFPSAPLPPRPRARATAHMAAWLSGLVAMLWLAAPAFATPIKYDVVLDEKMFGNLS